MRALVRRGSYTAPLATLGVELVQGDLRDYDSLSKAVRGCGQVYHAAADYRLWVPDPEVMYATNVQGTINIMQAALRRDVPKIVYTSTVGVLAPADGGKPGNENTPANLQDLSGHYKKSKFLAEQEVRKFVDKGLPVVIVNPTAPIGAMDRKPTPTGKTIVDFLNGKIPAYLDTGLNFVDVEDVAQAHLLASESGIPGERYILGHENLTLKEFLHLLARLSGRKAPRRKLPYAPVYCLAVINQAYSKFCRGKAPAIPLDGVRMARRYMFFDCSRAVRELSMPQNSVETAVKKAIDWFNSNGYVTMYSREKVV